MRRQLRPFWSPDEIRDIYHKQYDHIQWPEHKQRVQATIDIATMFADGKGWSSAADLSCGDGAIIKALYANGVIDFAVMGDVAAGLHIHPRYLSLIQDTLPALVAEYPPFDLYVFSETIEHLEDPDATLRQIRDAARNMVLSTPVSEEDVHGNQEHYWSWDTTDIREMLLTAGWMDCQVNIMPCDFYTYQIWTCS